MPELPEVETVRNTLKQHIIGKTIEDVIIRYPKIVKTNLIEFKKRLKNQTILDIKRMGKYLIFIFNHDALIIHLRMEGKFYIKKNEPYVKHEHIIFNFNDQSTLRYHDVRKFGTMHLHTIKTYKTVYPLSKLGPEPKDMLPKLLYDQIKNKKRNIKSVLLDQSIISGLGNIYVDETLYLSKIHPKRCANSLKLSDVKNILIQARKVLNQAIRLGGTTIYSYTSSLGVHGKFQNELKCHTKNKEPCGICQNKIEKIIVSGRGTYVCQNCQK